MAVFKGGGLALNPPLDFWKVNRDMLDAPLNFWIK